MNASMRHTAGSAVPTHHRAADPGRPRPSLGAWLPPEHHTPPPDPGLPATPQIWGFLPRIDSTLGLRSPNCSPRPQ